ncbi:hypothetical protein [Metaplanococcus flavidus]|uniref:Oligosaccharide repeat unit polymerase n=1 Tax=Metaplanococcus flavidus TaxID=569883 RepID=A0ABW3L9U0_9BACL
MLDDKIVKIIPILINVLAGISLFYYLVKIDQQFVKDDIFNVIILIIFTVKFTMDLLIFKIGYASFSLMLLFLPIVSLLGFAPHGEVQPLFNDPTQLIEKHFYILAFSALFFYFVWSLLLLITKKSFAQYDFKVLSFFSGASGSRLSTWFFSIVSIAAAIIYLPDIPGKAYQDLSESLLPGNAWNSVVAISYFFVLIGSRNSSIRNIALVFVPFWLLSHYARVDILGLILIMYIIITNTKKGKLFIQTNKFRKIGILAVGVLIFSYLGLVRETGLIFDASAILDSFYNLVNYPTVQDLIYSTAAAIEVNQQYGNTYTLVNYIPQLVPFFSGLETAGASHIVASNIHTNYGLLVYGEYYMNYQVIGILIAPFLTFFIVFFPAYLLTKIFGGIGFALGYYMVVTTVPRVMWYGFIYYIKPMLIIVPIFIVIYLIIVNFEKELAVFGQKRKLES